MLVSQLRSGRVDFRSESTYFADFHHNGDYCGVVGRVNKWARSKYGTSLIYNLTGDRLSKVIPGSSAVAVRGFFLSCSESLNLLVWDKLKPYFSTLIFFLLVEEKSWDARRFGQDIRAGTYGRSKDILNTSVPYLPYEECVPSEEGLWVLAGELSHHSIDFAVFNDFYSSMVMDKRAQPLAIIQNLEGWREFHPLRKGQYKSLYDFVTGRINTFTLKTFRKRLIKSVIGRTDLKKGHPFLWFTL